MILIVDNRIDSVSVRALLKDGHCLIKLPKDRSLPDSVASHPDTVMFCSGREIITTADYCDEAAYIFSDLRELAPDVRISFTAETRGRSYPKDCIMNALVIGKDIFCKADTVSEGIKDFAARLGLKIINVKQGYPACSVLHFGNSAITSDEGLARVMSERGIKVTLISSGHISLPPYEYGFIGGAGGVVGRKVYFFGDINTHPDCERICSAIRDEGYIPVSLSDGELSDLGGIIAL